jgi:glycosyltransferase involved in cell wall biosynthesis
MVLEMEQPDLVHIEHLMGIPFGFVEDLHKRSLPYVVTLHDYWYICANAQLLTNTEQTICAGPDAQALNCARCAVARAGNKNASGIAPLLAPLMNRRNSQASAVLKRASQIIAPTNFVRDVYLPFLPADSNIEVLPHGIDLPEKTKKKGCGEQKVPRQDGRLHVGYIGSIAWQKGVHVLISAINLLSEEDVSLTIYGDPTAFPEYTSELEGLIKRPGIEFRGALDRVEIWPAIADFDVVVIPTLWYETSVLVIDEVYAMGVPVIGSDIGVMSEKLEDGVDGRLFAPGDVAALRDILSELIASPDTLLNWRRNIKPVYDIDDHKRALEKLYHRAIGSEKL